MKRLYTILFILIFTFSNKGGLLFSSEIDVTQLLEKELVSASKTDRFYILYQLCELSAQTSYEKTLEYGNQAIAQAKELENPILEANILELLGNLNIKRQEWSDAISYYNQAKSIYIKEELTKNIILSNISIGSIYEKINDYNKARGFFLEAKAKISDSVSMAQISYKLGYVFYKINIFDTALIYYQKALDFYQKNNFYYSATQINEGIGELYHDWAKYSASVKYYYDALRSYQYLKDENGILNVQYAIAGVYYDSMLYDTSNKYIGYIIQSKFINNETLAKAYILKGLICRDQGMLRQSIEAFNTSLKIAGEVNNSNLMLENYKLLYESYLALQDYQKALENYSFYHTIKEFFQESTEQVAGLVTQIAIENNEKRLQLQNQQMELQNLQLSKQKNMLIFSILGVLLMVFIALLIYRQSIQRKRTNIVLELQKEEILSINDELKQQQEEILSQKEMLQDAFETIEQKSKIVEQTNVEMMDNIRYARRIQRSILPQDNYISTILSDYFIFFRPRDILSGDFYWIQDYPPASERKFGQNTNILIAAVDCTGHGVSGALLSIMGDKLLNRAVFENNLSKPSDILNYMHAAVDYMWEHSQVESEMTVHDGMDMTLVNIDYANMKMQFAGAKNPIYFVRDKVLKVYSGTKKAIGERSFDKEEELFQNHEIDLQSGDIIYMFSDGYADQFGGPKNKKFKESRMQEMLLFNIDKKMEEQQKLVAKNFDDWKGNYDQIDDVLLIGIRIP